MRENERDRKSNPTILRYSRKRKIIRQVATGHDYRALLRVTIHAVFDVTHFRYLLRISSKYEA